MLFENGVDKMENILYLYNPREGIKEEITNKENIKGVLFGLCHIKEKRYSFYIVDDGSTAHDICNILKIIYYTFHFKDFNIKLNRL